jgi:hypothetical protein
VQAARKPGTDQQHAAYQGHRREGDLYRTRSIRLGVVKVDTSDQGGFTVLVCAPFSGDRIAVVTAIEDDLKPSRPGRNPDDIEDIWQAVSVSSSWRRGPVLDNALSGIDAAPSRHPTRKRAGMPVINFSVGAAAGQRRPTCPPTTAISMR